MSEQQKSQSEETSGRRTLINILLFMFGTVAILLAVKFIFGM
jgi:hypothetical protein